MTEKFSANELVALTREFDTIDYKPQSIVKDSHGNGYVARALAYITARDVQDRLDGVFCGDWSFDWEPVSSPQGVPPAVKGVLTIRGVMRAECGQAEQEGQDDWKSAVSDAFKRCAVQFGIGRYLYALEPEWRPCEVYQSDGGKPRFKRWAEKPIERPRTTTVPVEDVPAKGATAEGTFCADCNVAIIQAVKIFSEANFGRALCRKCQDKAKKVAK